MNSNVIENIYDSKWYVANIIHMVVKSKTVVIQTALTPVRQELNQQLHSS